jgi:6-phosphofructokinase 1
MIKTIALVTSGGDAPGMNPAIRAVVRYAIFYGLKVKGVEHGFEGLIHGDITDMGLKSVSGIINRGGTILKTIRSRDFEKKSNRTIAYENLKREGIDGLIVIGGDGSLRGASVIAKEAGVPVIHIPASIDNDIPCTEETIGFDTAVNTALDAIDKIRDTASSHERMFIVEVMGRDSGFLALEVGLTAGAEIILIPERKTALKQVCRKLREGIERGKMSSIIVVAEGFGKAPEIAKVIAKSLRVEVRVTVLGYIQRGGSPTADSRRLASVLGAKAVELLIKGEKNKMVGLLGSKIVATDFDKVLRSRKKINFEDYKLAEKLSK